MLRWTYHSLALGRSREIKTSTIASPMMKCSISLEPVVAGLT